MYLAEQHSDGSARLLGLLCSGFNLRVRNPPPVCSDRFILPSSCASGPKNHRVALFSQSPFPLLRRAAAFDDKQSGIFLSQRKVQFESYFLFFPPSALINRQETPPPLHRYFSLFSFSIERVQTICARRPWRPVPSQPVPPVLPSF